VVFLVGSPGALLTDRPAQAANTEITIRVARREKTNDVAESAKVVAGRAMFLMVTTVSSVIR
jgi:hypothetical protein